MGVHTPRHNERKKQHRATTQPTWPPRIQRSKPAAATPSSTPPASPPHPATPLIHTNPTPLPSHAPYAHRSRDAAPMPLHFHQTQPSPHAIHPSATHRRPHTDTPYTSVCTPTAHTPSPAYASSLPASGARTTSQTTRRAPQTARVRPHHTTPHTSVSPQGSKANGDHGPQRPRTHPTDAHVVQSARLRGTSLCPISPQTLFSVQALRGKPPKSNCANRSGPPKTPQHDAPQNKTAPKMEHHEQLQQQALLSWATQQR